MKKTENDYLAEYVRENRPEIEQSITFLAWRIGRQLRDVVSAMTDLDTTGFANLDSEDE